ncbi:PAS domain S-box protein [Aliifodinibius sp. S!AR15-10]|uniref:PAS domain S-box protein n=1 Tax=Aliifodinibius sp. S!AR15-10 TaxID=2950437 RepID=UPI0028610C04|nr:PAS domain S-box protein [Aliifodinibius sp. S!AR15-10]MDR8391338.1 PAS domain S-box protein [Aliifodinibius sp. S!AR15-10]
MGRKRFTARFKARVALQALEDEGKVKELATEHEISSGLIEEWVEILRNRSEGLFMDNQSAPDEEQPDTLRDYLSLLRATLDATANGVLVVDKDGKITIYNDRFLEMWNIPEHIISGQADKVAVQYVLDQIENPDEFLDKIRELYNRPEATSKDEIVLKDGRIIERYSFPQRVGNKIVGRVWSFMDVTESRATQKKMNRFGRLLKSINANVEEAILRSTPSEGLVYVNDAFVDMFGYQSKEEALSVPPEQYYKSEAQRWDLVNKLTNKGRLVNEEVEYKRKNGSTFWGLENCTLVETDGKQFIDCVILDVTKRREVEEALRQSEEKYRAIVENIEDGYFETNLEGNFTFFNESLQRILGYSRKELFSLDRSYYMDKENARDIWKVCAGVYQTGEPVQGRDWEVITKGGKTRSVEASISPKKDSNEEPSGFRGIVRDITDRKRYEKRIKKSLNEKEILLGEIHHRVKNNLAVISGLLFLQADQTLDETAESLLKQSRSRIHSMAVVHEMLYDSRSFASISPEEYVHKLIEFITRNLDTEDKNIETEVITGDIQLKIQESIPCALIINELLTNAYKYAFQGRTEGKITIRFEPVDELHYQLVVADNGIGFDKKSELTKDMNDGLGLYLVNTLIKQLKGDVSIDTSNGTRFVITFPATQTAVF